MCTLELVSTLTSAVMLFLFNCVFTSARNISPFFVPDDVIAYMVWKMRIQVLMQLTHQQMQEYIA